MAAGMMSRWPVLLELAVTEQDCDADGRLTDHAVERLFADARASYFDQCSTVDETSLQILSTAVHRGAPAVAGPEADTSVTISVSVVEVFPDRFTMHALVRGGERGDVVAQAVCSLSTGGDVTTAMRDEFIAIAHAARHFH